MLVCICFLAQTANAQVWSATKRLTWNPSWSSHPDIAADYYGNLHVIWYDMPSGNGDIFYKRSTDGGSTWSAARRLTWDPGESERPALTTNSNDHVHVVWQDLRSGNWEIYYKRSTDGGSSWSSVQRLTWNDGASLSPIVVSDKNNHLHLVWDDVSSGFHDIYYRRSTNGGMAWSATKRLTWTSHLSATPTIAADSNNRLHVVYFDDGPGNNEVFYKRSTDGGSTWSAPKRLTWTSGYSFNPVISVDTDNRLHVVWHDDTPGTYEIYYKRSTNAGSTWESGKRLTWNLASSAYPQLLTYAKNRLHVVWQCDTELYYKNSVDGGNTWLSKRRLTWNTGDSIWPAIAIALDDDLHVVWHDDTPGNPEIYYRNRK